jgi:hypothetical protein
LQYGSGILDELECTAWEPVLPGEQKESRDKRTEQSQFGEVCPARIAGKEKGNRSEDRTQEWCAGRRAGAWT